MKKSHIIIIALLVIAASAAVFSFKESLIGFYRQSVEQFKTADVGTLINEIKREISAPTPLSVGGQENSLVFTKAKVIAETNVQRYNNGMLSPLTENAKLNAAALAKAEDMFKNQYFEHVSPSGVDPGTLAKRYGYDYIVEGENLILGNFESEQDMVQDWMNSPGHRANILNNRYTEIGVAVVKGMYEGHTVWIGVQEFGLPLSACASASQSIKNQIDANKNQLDQLQSQIDAKREELNNTNQHSAEYNKRVDEYNALVQQYNALSQETKNLISQYNGEVNAFNQCVSGA